MEKVQKRRKEKHSKKKHRSKKSKSNVRDRHKRGQQEPYDSSDEEFGHSVSKQKYTFNQRSGSTNFTPYMDPYSQYLAHLDLVYQQHHFCFKVVTNMACITLTQCPNNFLRLSRTTSFCMAQPKLTHLHVLQ